MTHVFLLAAIAAVQTPSADAVAGRFNETMDALRGMTPAALVIAEPIVADAGPELVFNDEPANFNDDLADFDDGQVALASEPVEVAQAALPDELLFDTTDDLAGDPVTLVEPETSVDALNDLMALVRDIQKNLGVPSEMPTGADLWRAITK